MLQMQEDAPRKHPAENIYLMYSSSMMLDSSSSILSSRSGKLPQSKKFVPDKEIQMISLVLFDHNLKVILKPHKQHQQITKQAVNLLTVNV